MQCLDNMPGGGGISNVEITGIPLNWLIERGGGMKDGELVLDAACTQKELMLRTLINKCMNDFVKSVKTRDVWGTDLTRFGFQLQDGYYVAGYETLRLPHDCGH